MVGSRELTREQRQLAEITEMIHTASLVHDDVLDECDLRRGAATVNSKYGTRLAVLAGDYLFAQVRWQPVHNTNTHTNRIEARLALLVPWRLPREGLPCHACM